MPLSPVETEVATVKPTSKLNIQTKITAEPMVHKVTHNNNSKPLRHLHPLVQNKVNLLDFLRPTKLRLTRVARQAVHNSHPQAQSVQIITDDNINWACPVFHPNTGNKQSLDQLLQGPYNPTWNTSLTNIVGQLAQGIGKNRPHNQGVKGTNTLFFIQRSQIPKNTKVTYANLYLT